MLRQLILNIVNTTSGPTISIERLVYIIQSLYPNLTASQIKSEVYPLISSGKLKLDDELNIQAIP